jgi:hypothetical protein
MGRPKLKEDEKAHSRNIRTTNTFWAKIDYILDKIGKWSDKSKYIVEAVEEKNVRELRKFNKGKKL